MQKIDPPETWVYWFKMKILLCKVGKRKHFYLINFFDCLGKFWTLYYSSKTQWSNSQNANFIGFKQGQFWSPYMWPFHLAYFKSACQFMRVRPHQGRTVFCKLNFPEIIGKSTEKLRAWAALKFSRVGTKCESISLSLHSIKIFVDSWILSRAYDFLTK